MTSKKRQDISIDQDIADDIASAADEAGTSVDELLHAMLRNNLTGPVGQGGAVKVRSFSSNPMAKRAHA